MNFGFVVVLMYIQLTKLISGRFASVDESSAFLTVAPRQLEAAPDTFVQPVLYRGNLFLGSLDDADLNQLVQLLFVDGALTEVAGVRVFHSIVNAGVEGFLPSCKLFQAERPTPK
jgi:hypothetical protein